MDRFGGEMKDMAGMLIQRHGEKFHAKMQASTVGLAGLGGLGSPIAMALVRMGLGRLTAYDFDEVDLSNIHRQQYYIDQIGMKKCDALRDTLERISPLTRLEFIDARIDEKNIDRLFEGCDIIIEAVDDEYTKAMLFDKCAKYYPGAFYIGASGVSGYSDEKPVSVKQLGDRAYIVGDFHSEDISLFASKVGIIAHMQANLAVKLIVEKL